MSVVSIIRDLLIADPTVFGIVADRVYPMQMPDAPTFPLVVIFRVGGATEYDLQGDAGIEQARVQIDMYTDAGYTALDTLRKAVRAVISGYPQNLVTPDPSSCVVDSIMIFNDQDLPTQEFEAAGPDRLRRRMLEVYVWNRDL